MAEETSASSAEDNLGSMSHQISEKIKRFQISRGSRQFRSESSINEHDRALANLEVGLNLLHVQQ